MNTKLIGKPYWRRIFILRRIMNENIRKVKWLIEEYEELCEEAEEISNNWDSDDPCIAAMSDPSDQYMKGLEIEEKYNEIKEVLKLL